MDRLFSKFQLGDIKVGEESNFPPDAEPHGEQQAVQAAPAAAEDQLTEHRAVPHGERTYRPGYGQGVPEQRGEVLKVSSRSRPSAVAGAIAGVVRESGRAEVQAIGAGAANQAIKAVAIARDYLIETGIEAICLPSLIDLQIADADRTAIRLVVETR
jgi:stage V sporulation protein S